MSDLKSTSILVEAENIVNGERDNLVDLAGYAEILNRINNDKNK